MQSRNLKLHVKKHQFFQPQKCESFLGLLHDRRSIAYNLEAHCYTTPNSIRLKKDKPFDEQFEDRVWVLFYNMGFKFLNKDRNFRMSYDFQNPDFTQQIDVFAADDETIIIV